MTRWNEITKQQFQLSYFGTIPYNVSDQMTVHEREHLFGLLREQRDNEMKAQEEAIKRANANRSSASTRRSRKSRRHS